MEGRVKVCQSSDEPLRTTSALVKAANIMVMAKSTTQMAVEDGGGEYSSATRRLPSAGTRFRQPPWPERPSSGKRSIFGGSGIVVAIAYLTPLRLLFADKPLKGRLDYGIAKAIP